MQHLQKIRRSICNMNVIQGRPPLLGYTERANDNFPDETQCDESNEIFEDSPADLSEEDNEAPILVESCVMGFNSKSTVFNFKAACSAALIIVFAMIIYRWTSHPADTFYKLQQRYPGQTELLWQTVQSLFLSDARKMSPVILFIHDGRETPKVETMLNAIAVHITAAVGDGKQPFEMQLQDFASERSLDDYGHIVKTFKEHVQGSRVAILPTLNEIPAVTAESLHFICDTYSPIEPDVVIFLTLIADNEGHPTKVATHTLERLWQQKLHRDVMEPLLTRLTEQVIPLQTFAGTGS